MKLIKQTSAFETEDGDIFKDENDAKEHEYALIRARTIAWFIEQQEGYTKRGKVTATRIIGNFLDDLNKSSINIPLVPQDEIEETS